MNLHSRRIWSYLQLLQSDKTMFVGFVLKVFDLVLCSLSKSFKKWPLVTSLGLREDLMQLFIRLIDRIYIYFRSGIFTSHKPVPKSGFKLVLVKCCLSLIVCKHLDCSMHRACYSNDLTRTTRHNPLLGSSLSWYPTILHRKLYIPCLPHAYHVTELVITI